MASRRARFRQRLERMAAELAEPEVDERDQADEDDECPRCHGDGADPWNDYLLPCPECGGRD